MEGAARQSAEGQHEREQPYVAREPRPPVQALVLARDEVGEPATERARAVRVAPLRRVQLAAVRCAIGMLWRMLLACCGMPSPCYSRAIAMLLVAHLAHSTTQSSVRAAW